VDLSGSVMTSDYVDKPATRAFFGNSAGPNGVAAFGSSKELVIATYKAFPIAGIPGLARMAVEAYVKGVIKAKYSKQSLSALCPVKND
jgi:hypothetical protein